jgi:ribonuclease HI
MKPSLNIYSDGGMGVKLKVGSSAIWVPSLDYKFSMVTADITNNQAELMAFILALKFGLEHPDKKVTIISDSEYVLGGYNHWIDDWKEMGTFDEKKNADLWQIIYDLKYINGAKFVTRHCRGHKKGTDDSPEDVEGNDVVDRLCTKAVKDYKALVTTS